MTKEAVHQHGVKGVYLGGEWLPIEECASRESLFENSSDKCNKSCHTCPRSRSRHSSQKEDGTYDVIIIGAGCIGASIARELSKTTCSVLILEAADDVTQGATKGNSGIVHAGFDDKPGSIRAKFCWPGNQMFPKLDEDLHFGYQRNGSLVLARGVAEEIILEELLERGKMNGVKRLQILTRDEVLAMEPHVHPDVTAALYSPDAGNVIPYEYTIALAENAVDNGVELRIRREVTSIDFDSTEQLYTVTANHWEPLDYISNVMQEEKKKNKNDNDIDEKLIHYRAADSSANVGATFIQVATIGATITGLILKIILPFLFRVLPQYADIYQQLISNQVVLLIFIIISTSIIILYTPLYNIAYPKVTQHAPIYTDRFKSIQQQQQQSKIKSSFQILPAGRDGGREVTVDEMKIGGSGSSSVMQGQTVEIEKLRTRYIINCAGCYSDKIAAMIGDHSFKIKPRIGNYILLNRNQGHLTRTTLFPCPHPVLGKGVLVQTTLWGNLILGPTARDMHLPEVAAETTADIMRYIITKCRELVPSFDIKEVIHTFAGARAKNSTGDWVIGISPVSSHFINVAGIDSPGLAGSPAIAIEVIRLLKEEAGLNMIINDHFNPIRAPIIIPKHGWRGIKVGPVGKIINNPKENVICKCEKVTEYEVITALHRSLPIDSTQAIRKRTRAGMGVCQGDIENYNCECRVADIIARETGLPPSAVGRRPWPATSSLPSRWLSDEQKEDIAKSGIM